MHIYDICLQDFQASLQTLCASVLAGSFEAQLKKAKEYVTSLALDADELEDKESAKFEDGRAIHHSVKNGGRFYTLLLHSLLCCRCCHSCERYRASLCMHLLTLVC